MCNCGKTTSSFCNDCNTEPVYNYYYADICEGCNGSETPCTKTIDAKCVINNEDLDFFGVVKGDKLDLQAILISINNAIKSISNMECVDYTRVINPDTGVATYTHELNYNCIANHICPICNA